MKVSRRITTFLLTLVLLCSTFSMTAHAESNLLYGIGFVKGTYLRLREKPTTSSAMLATAYGNECIVILGKEGDWYHVLYNLKEGYMYKDYLTVATAENAELGYGKVTASMVNLREGPGTNYNRIGSASAGEKLYIIGLNAGWYKVIYGSSAAYIRSDYLQLTEAPYENRASANSPKYFRTGKSIGELPFAATAPKAAVGSATGPQILAEAQKYLGCPYVMGGATPSGFDCSGYVYYVLKNLGYAPARTPAAQFSMGVEVKKSDLRPGDIVCFAGTASGGISHVGIYAGNGQFIHAPNSRSVVSYSDLTSGYWAEHFYGARRVSA